MTFSLALPIILARVLGVCATGPGFATEGIGLRPRLLIGVLITLTVGPVLRSRISIPVDATAWIASMFSEFALGAILGTSAGLIVAGARQAGEIVGAQAGLSAAALFDPDAGDDMTPTGHLYGAIAMAVYLLADGPLLLTRSLIESYDVWPASGFALTAETASSLFRKVGESLGLALRASAPVAAALTLAGLAIALAARNAPSMPFSAMALPIRSTLGLIFVLLGLVGLIATFSNAWADWPATAL